MKLQNKYSIGTHVMFYEIEMFTDFIDGMINLMEIVDNNENVYFDIAFNVSQFFEKIDLSKIDKKSLVERFYVDFNRLKPYLNESTTSVRIIDDDLTFYTQTDYRREYNSKFCKLVDFVMWGETDSFFPKQSFQALDVLKTYADECGIHRYVACFADRKMWDSSWDVTVHPKYLDHRFVDAEFWNPNQAKSPMAIDLMNDINFNMGRLELNDISYPKIDGSCLVMSSDFIRAGVNIPPCFIHNDDESLAIVAKQMMGSNYRQFIFKNILKVHARRHPKKRMYVLNENNPNGFCDDKKGSWWGKFTKMSQHNISILTNSQGKFLTFEDFKKEL